MANEIVFRVRPNKRKICSSYMSEVPSKYVDCEFNKFSLIQLQSICKLRLWKGYSKFKKAELIDFVERKLLDNNEALFDNARLIVARPTRQINDIDAVSQESLVNRSPAFVFTMESTGDRKCVRNVHAFDPLTFIEMISHTGNLENPFNRQELSKNDIKRLEICYFNVLLCNPQIFPDVRFRFRPDMQKHYLKFDFSQSLPSGIDPIPIETFAPWISNMDLLTFAEIARSRNRSEQVNLSIIEYIRYTITDAMAAIAEFLQMEIEFTDVPNNQVFLDITMSVFAPVLFERLSNLMDVSLRTTLEVLRDVVVDFFIRVTEEIARPPIVRNSASWLLAMMIDTTRSNLNSRNIHDSHPYFDDYTILVAYIDSVSIKFSCDTLVNIAVNNFLRLMRH